MLKGDVLDAQDDKLGDSVAWVDDIGRHRVGVHKHDAQLAAVPGVDQPRRIEAGDAVAQREPAPRQHEPPVTLGDGDCEPACHGATAPTWGKLDALSGDQVAAGVAVVGVLGNLRPVAERHDADGEHDGRLANPLPSGAGRRADHTA